MAIYDEALASVGINIAQFSFLRNIDRQGGAVALTELGGILDLDRSTIGRNARVLERLGLIELGRGKTDQRETTIGLTENGRKAIHDSIPLWEAAQARVHARLGDTETRQLLQLLNGF